MLARVGLMLLKECTGVMRPICCGETRILFRATDSEFIIVLRETAVKPPGRCRFA
jgi:GGDEF domain-containing protein